MKRYTQVLLAVVLVCFLMVTGACTKKAVKKDAGLGEETAGAGNEQTGRRRP